MALVLARQARMTGKVELEAYAWKVLQAFSSRLNGMPHAHSQMLMALDFLAGPSTEVVVVEGASPEDNSAILRSINRAFRPRMVLLRKSSSQADSLAKLAAFTADQVSQGDKATIYVCHDFTCAAPTTDLKAALKLLDQVSPKKPDKN